MVSTQPHQASDSHLRGIAVTLGLLDEALCEFEEWARGRARRSVLYQERNRLTRKQRQAILAEVASVRRSLRDVRDTLGLPPAEREAGDRIRAVCASLWAYLIELEPKRLRRYGELPKGLGDYLGPKLAELIAGVGRVRAAAGGRGRGRRADDVRP